MKKNILVFVLLSGFIANAQKPAFNHIAIYVKDLETATNFYQNIIGLDTISNPFHDGKHTWFSIGNAMELHLIAGTPSTQTFDQSNHFCFSVHSMEAFTKKLSLQRIAYENLKHEPNSVTMRPDGVKQIYLKDPDGHWVEINDAKQ